MPSGARQSTTDIATSHPNPAPAATRRQSLRFVTQAIEPSNGSNPVNNAATVKRRPSQVLATASNSSDSGTMGSAQSAEMI